jgi:hypothetical protein
MNKGAQSFYSNWVCLIMYVHMCARLAANSELQYRAKLGPRVSEESFSNNMATRHRALHSLQHVKARHIDLQHRV